MILYILFFKAFIQYEVPIYTLALLILLLNK